MNAAVSIRDTIPAPPPSHLMTYERAIVQYAPLIEKLTRRYRGRDDYPDMLQEARLGLFRACDTYRDDGGASFVGWASTWIRGALAMARQLTRRRGLGGKRNLDLGEVLSIDAPVGEDGGTFHDLIGVEPPQVDLLGGAEERAKLRMAALTLSPRHLAMLDAYADGLTLEEVGEQFGICRERVRQLLVQVVKRMRRDLAKRRETAKAIPVQPDVRHRRGPPKRAPEPAFATSIAPGDCCAGTYVHALDCPKRKPGPLATRKARPRALKAR